mgnify:CR=1 FL=1
MCLGLPIWLCRRLIRRQSRPQRLTSKASAWVLSPRGLDDSILDPWRQLLQLRQGNVIARYISHIQAHRRQPEIKVRRVRVILECLGDPIEVREVVAQNRELGRSRTSVPH